MLRLVISLFAIHLSNQYVEAYLFNSEFRASCVFLFKKKKGSVFIIEMSVTLNLEERYVKKRKNC